MARRAINVFSFLDGDDEDTSMLAERLVEKAEAARLAEAERQKQLQMKLMNQNQNQQHRASDNGRDSNWHGREYHGRGPRRNVVTGGQLVDNNHSNGFQQKNGAANGYRHDNLQSGGNQRDDNLVDGVPPSDGHVFQGNNRRYDGYQGNYRRNNGYQGNCRGEDGYQGNYWRGNNYQGEENGNGYQENYIEHDVSGGEQIDSYQSGDGRAPYYRRNNGGDFANGNRMGQGRGYARGGRSYEGRGSNQGYYRSKSRDVEANEQPESVGQDERQPLNGEHDDGKYAADQLSKDVETKEVQSDNAAGSDGGSVVNEASKEPKPKQKKLNGNVKKLWSEMTEEEKKAIRAKRDEEKAIEIEEERKLKTLEEFEKICLEKKKALLEASKTEERKVTLDKEFESMQLIHKKKEDVTFIEPHSEKDQLKKKNNLGKDEKAVKSININELFQTSGGQKFERRGGQNEGSEGRNFDRRDGPKSTNSGQEEKATLPEVMLKDESQFPVLGGSVK